MAINEPVLTLTFEQSVKQIQDSLAAHSDAAEIPIQLFLIGSVLKPDRKSAYESIGPLEASIDDKVQDWLFHSVVSKYVDRAADKELYDLNEVDEPGEDLLRHIALDQIQEMTDWVAAIQRDNCPSVRAVLGRDDFKPKVMVLRVSLDEHYLYFLKTVNESALLKNKKILKLVNQDAFTIDPEGAQNIVLDDLWDAVLIGERLVLFRESAVLHMFKFYATVWADAQVTLTQLESTQLIANFTEVSDYVQRHISYQKKLARLQAFSITQGQKNRLFRLIRVGKISLKVDANGQLLCNSDKEIRAMLDVVFDNYVKSMITRNEYKAANKTKL